MKKKSLLSLLFLMMFFGIAKAETIQIGSGTNTGVTPLYTNWKYCYSEQIYTNAEIGHTGSITSIAFYATENDPGIARTIDIYLVNTNKSSYTSDTDFLTASESDKVFSGSVTYTIGDWTTITLDKPFQYDGSTNLCVIVNDKTGAYANSSTARWLAFNTGTGQGLTRFNDNSGAYDPASPASVESSASNPIYSLKNQLQLTFSDGGSKTPIHSVNVNGYESPVAGENATDHLNITLPSDANYSFAYAPYWYNDDEYKNFTGTFVAGTHYSLGMTLRANDGYYFADDCTFYLNGSTELVDNRYTAVNSEDNSRAYFWSVSAAATGGGSGTGETIQVGSGENTNWPSPTNTCWENTYSQQIYLASEIAKTGTITSLAFCAQSCNDATITSQSRTLDIYMLKTSKSYFSSNTDWLSVSESDKVYSGTVTFTVGDWTTITLNKPFEYDGTANLCIVVNDKSGSEYEEPINWLSYWRSNNELLYETSSSSIDPLSPPTGDMFKSKAQLQLTFSGGGGTISAPASADFETGDFSQIAFENDATYPWIVTSDDAASGTYCMKSGNSGQNSTSSAISVTVSYASDGYIIFDAKCMGEGENTAWDKCIFYIDGEAQFTYGAYKIDSWETYYFLVTAGTHTFKWEYSKDNSVNASGDAFFVDNIQFGLGEPCVAPSELAYKLTASSATLTWKGFSEYFSLRYRKDGGDWQYVNALTEKSYTLTNLASGIYDVEVQASCNTSTCSGTFEIAGALSTAEWYAYAAYSMDGADWGETFINFSMQDVSTVQAVSPVLPENWAAAYADGYVWFITKDEGDLCRAPLYTETNSLGDYEVVVSGFETEGVAKEMAYNVADGKMYYLIDYNSGTKLKSFSPNDLSSVSSLTIDLVIQAFAINKNGEAYGITYETGKLYRINLADGHYALVGETGLAANYVQSMAFDLETDELFWAQISSASDVGIYKVNTATAVATYIGKTGTNGAELTGLFMLPSTAAKTAYIDFETGDFSQFTFENGSEYPWIVTSSDAASGTYCMMSGNAGVASSRSAIIATYTFDEDGYISFDAKCMGEGVNTVWDPCVFSIDNNDQFVYGARGDTWYAHVYPVAAGTHTFKWEYWKDNSQDPLGDAFFVDNIRFLQGNSALDVIATGVEGIDNGPQPSDLSHQTSTIYNLAGQRLANKQKGVNIVNGRKILVK